MTTQLPQRERQAEVERERASPDVLFEEARRRRQRRWIAGGALITVSVIAGALILGTAGGRGEGAGDSAHRQPSGSPSAASSQVRAHPTLHRVGVAALTVSVPTGWHWTVDRGDYRNCTNPIGDLSLASYRLPVGLGKHEGLIAVPANGILLEFGSAPVRSAARPWKQWRLSNHQLRPAHHVGPNRYAAEVNLPRSPAVLGTAWLGSIPTPRSVLVAANQILRSVRINQTYGCQ